MSIITKVKSTETFLTSLDQVAVNTKLNYKKSVVRFQKFCKSYQNNMTPEELCRELLIIKKQDEDKYIDTLYDILQDYVNYLSAKKNHLGTTTISLRCLHFTSNVTRCQYIAFNNTPSPKNYNFVANINYVTNINYVVFKKNDCKNLDKVHI